MPLRIAKKTAYRRKTSKGKKPMAVRVVKSRRKTTPKRKTINRKANTNRRAIGMLARNQNLIDKMLMTKLANRYITYSHVAESFDANTSSPGLAKLIYDDVVTGILPCHMYSLTAVPTTADITPRCRLDLKTNCYDFAAPTVSQYQQTAQTGFASVPDTTDWNARFQLHRYNNIKMVLWGREKYKTVYTLRLIQLFDNDLDPFDTDGQTVTNVTKQRTREAFYSALLKSQFSNPIATSKHHLGSFNGKFREVWHKKYVIREKLSTEDQMPHRIVKLFRQHDRLLDYGSESRLTNSPANNLNDPDEIIENSESFSQIQNEPKQNQRLFLMVTANVTKMESEGGTQAEDWASYDIVINNKFSCLGST